MEKVHLKENEAYCNRCGGYGTYYIRVLNGQGVPASPAKGICYRCKGSGVDPHIKKTKEELPMTNQRCKKCNGLGYLLKELGQSRRTRKSHYRQIKCKACGGIPYQLTPAEKRKEAIELIILCINNLRDSQSSLEQIVTELGRYNVNTTPGHLKRYLDALKKLNIVLESDSGYKMTAQAIQRWSKKGVDDYSPVLLA